jgi:hypothetical protein
VSFISSNGFTLIKQELLVGNNIFTVCYSHNEGIIINSSQMRFLGPLSGVTLRDRIKSEKIRKQWKVVEVIDDIQNYQQK